MSKTETDLAKQIGRELLLIDGGSELAGEDDATIKEIARSYHETLAPMGVTVTWAYDSIPKKVFIPLARVLAAVSASTFGEALPQVEIDARLAALIKAAAFPYLGQTATAEYF